MSHIAVRTRILKIIIIYYNYILWYTRAPCISYRSAHAPAGLRVRSMRARVYARGLARCGKIAGASDRGPRFSSHNVYVRRVCANARRVRTNARRVCANARRVCTDAPPQELLAATPLL